MRIAHITRTAASTGGRIAADLCRLAIREDHQVLFCYGSGPMPAGLPGAAARRYASGGGSNAG